MKRVGIVMGSVLLAVVVIIVSGAVAQGPQEDWIGKKHGMSKEHAAELQRFLAMKDVPMVDIDPFDARDAMRQMIETAGDDEIVAIYRASVQALEARADIVSRLDELRGRLERMRNSRPVLPR